MTFLKNKTVVITGASRGIGRSIALRCAKDGANVVILAKTVAPHAKLEGTIHSVANEVEQKGGRALALQLDVRDADQIQSVMEQAGAFFGGIDILVNNAVEWGPRQPGERVPFEVAVVGGPCQAVLEGGGCRATLTPDWHLAA